MDLLDQARAAIRTRDYFSAFPESPSPRVYGDSAGALGKAAFESHLGAAFSVQTPGADGVVATETSPYGIALDVAYPRVVPQGLDELVATAWAAAKQWRDAGPDRRAEVCLEILQALHARVFELAHAVQHTSGQAFVTAFQAGGTHALDRALEAIAYGVEAMSFCPSRATWTKAGRSGAVVMDKTYVVVPRGVALVIGCNTFPTWNSYPGLFASLVTGNPVIVKPHPSAVLPLAITVQAAQKVLTRHGFAAELVTLAAEREGDQLAMALATDERIRLIDFTGGRQFGDWLESHARQAVVFTEKAGVNPVVLDSTDDFAGMCDNLAFTLALYSGQMCTTAQNLFVPAAGIDTDAGPKTPDQVAAGISAALDRLLGDQARAVEILGAIVGPAVLQRVEAASSAGRVLIASRSLTSPAFPRATIRTPVLVGVEVSSAAYESECFGPVSFLITTGSTTESLAEVRRTVSASGAITASVYSTSAEVVEAAREVALDTGVALSENLTNSVYVNQSAAYSDFHGTGANPAASASYVDLAYVATRFHLVQTRRHG